MAGKPFPLVPQDVPQVHTQYRTICTQIPVPASVPRLESLRTLEARSMGGQPAVIWDHGEGFTVSDAYGNRWIDFTSGVLATASGHGRPEIVDAIGAAAGTGLYHTYCFATELRIRLLEKLAGMMPAPLAQVFLLTTGAEATECCIKLARTYGLQQGGARKSIFVSFEHAFHGRSMGAQLAGGIPGLKTWMGETDPRFVQVPYPDGFRQQDVSFEVFERTLAELGIEPDDVCGVMSETYQGGNATIMPPAYAQALRKWCDAHDAVLIFDEVQAGFGRTGKLFGFEHYGVVPDLVACGKGISGGMPLSAVLGTEELMGLYGPGEMTSTHSANPICVAAALANLDVIEKDGLVENAARMEPVLQECCAQVAEASDGRIGRWDAVGLVAALQFTAPGTTEPDAEPAWKVVKSAVERGLMLFAPVGVGGGAIKICPPLIIDEEGLREGMGVLRNVVADL
jgi:4-aminobutyrate aminotransferase / (S)-3-amino-2-methylpropionate transaminase / 5-aminovalerate transaminase